MLVFARGQVTAVILGIMQDGGLPHIGCRCSRCTAVYSGLRPPQYAACLGVVDTRGKRTAVWLFDATPDIKFQLNLVAAALGPHPHRPDRLRPPDGIFLTHAHMGHVGGLPELGPEAMAVAELPLFGPTRLLKLLADMPLWQPLTASLQLHPLMPNKPLTLAPGLRVTAVPVPHRDETNSGTFAYRIDGPQKSLLYLPDIDDWQRWPEAYHEISSVDTALLDASFFSPDELGGRPPATHPLIPDTLAAFSDLAEKIGLIHFNHTNPILDLGGAAHRSMLEAGAFAAMTGQMIPL